MPYHRPVILGAGLCLVALAGWGGRAALSRRPDPPAVPALLAALKADDVTARRRAVEALRNHGRHGDETVQPLVAALGDPDLVVQGGAGVALIVIGRPAVGPVVDALRSDDTRTRRGAVMILGRIHPLPVEAVGPLAAALGDADDQVRRGASAALGRIGPPAVPALCAALPDPRPE